MQKGINFIGVGILLAILNSNFAYGMFDNTPMVVTITSEYCSTCKKLEPILQELESEYNGQARFYTLKMSSRGSFEEARQIAEENGFLRFLETNKTHFPTVGLLCPGGEKVEKIFIGETNKDTYSKAIDELLSDTSQLCSL